MNPDLPSVEECREFLAVINRGREAAGLDVLEYLDFDGANPASTDNCLSARNLFTPAAPESPFLGTIVGAETVRAKPEVAEAVGAKPLGGGAAHVFDLPAEILKVTDAFDILTPGLRERMVEAGVVRP